MDKKNKKLHVAIGCINVSVGAHASADRPTTGRAAVVFARPSGALRAPRFLINYN